MTKIDKDIQLYSIILMIKIAKVISRFKLFKEYDQKYTPPLPKCVEC